jgi:hypothetical protein
MEIFTTTDPGDIREMPDMLRRTMAIARRITYGALALVLLGVFGAGLFSLGLLVMAAFDANSGCHQLVLDPLSYPSTDMGCDARGSGEDNKRCDWFQRSNSCMK